MLCQNCKRNDAGVHLKRIINGEYAEIHLCSSCAASLGVADFMTGFSSVGASRGGIFDNKRIQGKAVRCETCGFLFEDIARTGRPGCPDCYRVFAAKLRPSLQKIHGRAVFSGKSSVVTHKGDTSKQSEVVLSSRVRLSRNIDKIPFPVRLNTIQKYELNAAVCKALANAGVNLRIIEMNKLYPYEAISLAERHLISPEFAAGGEGRVLLLSDDEKISIMLNEKDHIRIQGFEYGAQLENAYVNALKIAEISDSALGFAFDGKLGFLNQNPKDIGTGLKASVLVHLPVLSKTGAMSSLAASAQKLGFSVRGSYGDGASVKGDIFRITNTVTMGISEEEALRNLKSFILQLATKERFAAEEYIKDINVKDKIHRSEGLIKNAYLLSTDEMMELLSWVRLGAVYGLLNVSADEINKLFVSMQPAGINVAANRKLSSEERDEIRAATVKKIFTD